MSLDKLGLKELEQLRSKLKEVIARNPQHSQIERVELEDVEQLIEERRNGREPSSEPSF
jgi:hypothetical protein